MSYRSLSVAAFAAAILVVLPTAPARAQDGRYSLSGVYSDGRATSGEVEIDGTTVTRTARIGSGTPFTWSTRSAVVSGGRVYATFQVVDERSVGMTGRLMGDDSGTTRTVNVFSATYTFDGDTISERVRNLTQAAPQDFWRDLATAGRLAGSGSSGDDDEEDVLDIEDGPKLHQLAAQTLVPELEALIEALRTGFGPETLPHAAKALRKQIGRVRMYLDLFQPVYPGGRGFDPWDDLRDELDEGYETMGAFKDLFDVQGIEDPALAVYDPAEVVERRDPVLAWKDSFLQEGKLAFYRYYLATPSDDFADRSNGSISPFFWTKDIQPKKHRSGLENFGHLIRDTITDTRKNLEDVLAIRARDLTKKSSQVPFHDFRKKLRSALNIFSFYPELAEARAADELLLAETVVDRFGQINDELVAYELAKDRGNRRRADELDEQIRDEWKLLKDFMRDERLDDELQSLHRHTRH